jgi:hypothetical protein
VDRQRDDVLVAEFDGPAHVEVDVHLATHGQQPGVGVEPRHRRRPTADRPLETLDRRDVVEVGVPLLGGLGQFRRRHPRDGVVLPAENPDPRRREHREHRRLHPPSEQTQLDGPVVLGDDARHLDGPADPEPLELPGGGRLVGAVVGVAGLPLDVPRQRGTGGREGGAIERRRAGTARESGDRGGAGAREERRRVDSMDPRSPSAQLCFRRPAATGVVDTSGVLARTSV